LAGVPDRLILWTAADSKAAAHFLKDRGDAAESLGALNRTGTIEVGKAADLVLLDANPLVDIANTKKDRWRDAQWSIPRSRRTGRSPGPGGSRCASSIGL